MTAPGKSSEHPPHPTSGEEDAAARPEPARLRAARERRRHEVFGDVLDGSTVDDRPDPGRAAPDGDRWLRENVPPHHGD